MENIFLAPDVLIQDHKQEVIIEKIRVSKLNCNRILDPWNWLRMYCN